MMFGIFRAWHTGSAVLCDLHLERCVGTARCAGGLRRLSSALLADLAALTAGVADLLSVPVENYHGENAVDKQFMSWGAVPTGAGDKQFMSWGAVPTGAVDKQFISWGAVPTGAVYKQFMSWGAVPTGAGDKQFMSWGAVPTGAVDKQFMSSGSVETHASIRLWMSVS
ncbi:hypothetical protein RRG08_058929 [Elysia crispata]|uniref:Uncharacterized protein n=1 Tax=Elysia crispata TaxID=231223 RepID=A0AAE0XSC3_9GAST|nr:hypothetical protein RRG08_058929 [Elysia crispata]